MQLAANVLAQSEQASSLNVAARPSPRPLRGDYELSNYLTARNGQIFLTGTQALVRLLVMQRWLDREQGLNTAGFVSGYRGSPLGAYDQQLWRARKTLDAQQIRFLPAVERELTAPAVPGSQQVETDPRRTPDAVFPTWSGKGTGVDHAGA